MILYNKLTELVATQFLFLVLFEVFIVGSSIFLFKRRPTVKIALFSIIVAFVLSLLSALAARGDYSGMAYHERLGWPFQYYSVSRGFEPGTIGPVPYYFGFDLRRFMANSIFWGVIPFLLLTEYFSKAVNKKYRIFAIISTVLFVFITICFSYYNLLAERNERIMENSPLKVLPLDSID